MGHRIRDWRPGRAPVAVVLAALVVGGCQQGSPGPVAGGPSPSGASTASSPPPPSEQVATPGPLEEILSADILLVSSQPLPQSVVEQVTQLRGVAQVEPLGLGQVSVQDRVVTVAQVDVAGYRRFTEERVARAQQVWERVAAGELAIARPLGRRLVDSNDSITLGSEDDAPRLHVGAFADQVPTIDAVVNQEWGAELGIRYGNALLISTGTTNPAKLRGRLQRLVGNDVSLQRIDVAAREGLDTSARQIAVLTGSTAAEVVGTYNYRVLEGNRVAPDPAWEDAHISTESVPILGQMTCNRAIFPQLRAALQEIVDSGLADKIHPSEYGGCYYPRFIANTTTLSNHAFGLAFDINVPGNLRGSVGEIDRNVVNIFNKWGFAWGGTWNWTDPMHFELNRLVEPANNAS